MSLPIEGIFKLIFMLMCPLYRLLTVFHLRFQKIAFHRIFSGFLRASNSNKLKFQLISNCVCVCVRAHAKKSS